MTARRVTIPMRKKEARIGAMALRQCVGVTVLMALAGCAQPMVFDTLRGDVKVYPDVVRGRPTLLAFLSANDRRCDKEIPSLWALSRRPESPVQVVGVMVYDDVNFLAQVSTRRQASFPVLLDPYRRLAEKFRIGRYPTYLFLSWKGKEIDRVHNLSLARQWVDRPRWHRKALPPDSIASPVPASDSEKTN